jgi:hypothetical protein
MNETLFQNCTFSPCPTMLEVLANFSHFVVLTNHSVLGETLRRGTLLTHLTIFMVPVCTGPVHARFSRSGKF